MRLMRMIGLGAIGYGMYKAYKTYSASRPMRENSVALDREIASRELPDSDLAGSGLGRSF